jgi:cytochrome c oxidase subunit II
MRRPAAPHALAVLAVLTTTACSGPQRILQPASDASAKLVDLFWVLLVGTGVPAILVIGLAMAALLRGRAAGEGAPPRDPPRERAREAAILIGAGAVFPATVVLILLVFSLFTGSAVLRTTGPPALTIEVVGHQFWWEVRYPEQGVTTANEIHLPAGASTLVRVSSADVIHSFWVPALHGKLDMVPGRTHEYRLEPREPGVFRGQCAEFCGVQHALMAMLVIAEPRADFDAWIAARTRPAPAPGTPLARTGEEVFERAGCSLCHSIRGRFDTRAVGQPGPDLTDLAARRTLAAVTVDNTPETVRAFVRDPHVLKPGVRMPATALPDHELDALVAYLFSAKDPGARP